MVARASSRMIVRWTQEKSQEVSYRAMSSIADLDSPIDKLQQGIIDGRGAGVGRKYGSGTRNIKHARVFIQH